MPRSKSKVVLLTAAILIFGTRLAAQSGGSTFYQRGTVYLDWYGSRYSDGALLNQVSARIKFDLIDRPGQGWTLSVDARDRVGIRGDATNQLILYNAR